MAADGSTGGGDWSRGGGLEWDVPLRSDQCGDKIVSGNESFVRTTLRT